MTGNDGFQFQPNVDILVTALGYYDRDQEGLALTHAVGIYDVSSQSLLATTTVGPGSTLDGLFRYTAIDPLSLRQGRSYMVVGFHPGSLTQDLAAANPAGVLAASDLTYQGYFLNFDAALSFPTTAGGPSPFFGPNFKFAVDSDGDGIADDDDECPDSDLNATVVIDGCDSKVTNTLFAGGCTISDLVAACAEGASRHGQFVSCVARMAGDLKSAGIITGQQRGAIQACADQADIP